VQVDLIVSRHINGTAVVQCGMKHGNCIIFRHIDLIQNSKSAFLGALVYASLAKLHLIVLKGIGPDQVSAVGIDMERYVIHRTSENKCQILCQHIFPSCLGAGKKKILPFQYSSHSHFQGFLSIKWKGRFHKTVLRLF